MIFDNLPIEDRPQKLIPGTIVHCFDGNLCSEDNYIGIAIIEETYPRNQAWCYSQENNINYQFWVIPVSLVAHEG